MIPAHQLGAIKAWFLFCLRHFGENHVRHSHAKHIFVCLKGFGTVYGSPRSSARSQDFWLEKRTFLPGRALELRLGESQAFQSIREVPFASVRFPTLRLDIQQTVRILAISMNMVRWKRERWRGM
jgi:hypothetical protein